MKENNLKILAMEIKAPFKKRKQFLMGRSADSTPQVAQIQNKTTLPLFRLLLFYIKRRYGINRSSLLL